MVNLNYCKFIVLVLVLVLFCADFYSGVGLIQCYPAIVLVNHLISFEFYIC